MAISSATITTSSTSILAENFARRCTVITNIGSVAVFINIGGAAEVNKGIYLAANGGTWVLDKDTFTQSAINGIVASGTTTISIYEG